MQPVIYTVGVFDLFHIGHANVLRIAAKIGKLCVGVCSDELNNKLKGVYPIFNQVERLSIIRNLKYVDSSFMYDNTDYSSQMRTVYADIFACGTDFGYRQDQVLFLDWCDKNLIPIVRIPRTKGISTSEIKERIKNDNIGRVLENQVA
jgi:cytidyltransferase-like protein